MVHETQRRQVPTSEQGGGRFFKVARTHERLNEQTERVRIRGFYGTSSPRVRFLMRYVHGRVYAAAWSLLAEWRTIVYFETV